MIKRNGGVSRTATMSAAMNWPSRTPFAACCRRFDLEIRSHAGVESQDCDKHLHP
jgi:hypothetical protein